MMRFFLASSCGDVIWKIQRTNTNGISAHIKGSDTRKGKKTPNCIKEEPITGASSREIWMVASRNEKTAVLE